MLIDGEKWACESCVKGHRVSGCNHRDRDLIRIAPKGRPVKQCEHCRGARKSKSHHAKCDCGEKKGKSASGVKLEEHGRACVCYHGAKCVCGSKSEPTGSDTAAKSRAKTRPAISTAHSESTLTVFANGHHKPCHRTNNLARTSGAPYRIPRAHSSTHTPTGSFYSAATDIPLRSDAGERSTTQPGDDRSLAAAGGLTTPAVPFGMGHGVRQSMGVSNLATPTMTVGSDIFGFDGGFIEPTMPSMQSANLVTSGLGPEDMTKADLWGDNTFSSSSMHALGDFSFSPTTVDGEWAGLSQPSIDEQALFGATDLPLTETAVSNCFPRPISLSGDSARCSAPTLTASSSGAQSEVGDSAFLSDPEHRQSIPPRDLFFSPSKEAVATERPPYMLHTSLMQDPFPTVPSAPLPDNRLSLDLNMLRQGPAMLMPDLSRSAVSQSHEVPINFWSAYAKNRRSPYEHGLSTSTFFSPSIPFEDDSRSLAIPASIEEAPDDMEWYSGLRTQLEQGGNLPSDTAWLNQL